MRTYLAEGMAALGDVGFIQPAHADGTVELLEDVIDIDLDLLNYLFPILINILWIVDGVET